TVLAAAAGPARPDELAGGASARAAFARAVALSGSTPRRPPMRRKLPVRLAVLATAGLLVGGVAAALASESGNDQHRAATTEVTNTEDTNDSTPPSTGAQGPDATGSAKFGLCNAYFSGQGGDHGNKNDSTAFQALAAAAASSPGTSDTERISAFCADVLAAKGGSDHANNGDNGTKGDDHGASQRDQHVSGNDNGKGNAPHGRP